MLKYYLLIASSMYELVYLIQWHRMNGPHLLLLWDLTPVIFMLTVQYWVVSQFCIVSLTQFPLQVMFLQVEEAFGVKWETQKDSSKLWRESYANR